MKIICALGGGGSTFMLRALERHNYASLPGGFDPYPMKQRLEKLPILIAPYNRLLGALGAYRGNLRVLMRPDSFWTDWRYHAAGVYDPRASTFPDDLRGQADYIIKTRRLRSGGLPLRRAQLATGSLAELVRSYLAALEALERDQAFTVVLLVGHWAEYGILAELDVEAVYLVRDPFNSLISHSKRIRHGKDYIRRGLGDINTREWIDAYLKGPHHHWLRFARAALEHDKATVVRYHNFTEEWRRVEGLPDVSTRFRYSENDVARILTRASIDYIYEMTHDVCVALGFDGICAKYKNA